ncbi:BTAD domain-containing putative transcriptional regulator [Amycolatopsis sp. NPDC059657]|uniref:BTAD domain-containing putative transcriptional regulator n=1 Tax=Amycolatopsis sp. NPDC059657 TaxID=3346899 RepID=UPI00366C3A9C
MSRHARQTARGLAALSALALLLGGVPALLLAWGADPHRLVPEKWPQLADLPHWPADAWTALRWGWLDGTLPAHVLIAVAWISWLTLATMILTEAARQLRCGIRPSRMPARRWIAGMVAAAILVCTAGTASALPATGTQIVATAPHRPPHPDTPAGHAGRTWADPAVRPDCPRIVVLAGDTLWRLATYYLGDGRRYREIEDLNADRIPRAGELYPNDLLLLPPDATHLPVPASSARTVRVQPEDTLSGIAVRELGDPGAWRVLFDLNRGRRQPDGQALRDPDLLRPDWQLTLPAPQNVTAAPEPEPPGDPASPPPSIPVPSTASTPTAPAEPVPPATSRPPAAPTTVGPTSADPAVSFDLSTDAYVGLGLAALITAAAVTVRLRRRRAYRPGHSQRDDSTDTPVVRALRIAHDTTTGGEHQLPSHGRPPDRQLRDQAHATADAVLPADGTTVVGVRDGHPVAVDLARQHGLGLVGPGAYAAARALVIALLAHTTTDTAVVIPAADVRALFGTAPADPPARLRIADNLPHALDICDTESPGIERTVLVTTPDVDSYRRLRATLVTGSTVTALLLGTWLAGGTAHVSADGTVTNTTTEATALNGTRLFHLPADDTADLLALLHDAQPETCDVNVADHRPPSTGGESYEFAAELAPGPADDPKPAVQTKTHTTEDAGTPTGPAPQERPPLRLTVLGRPRLLHSAAGQADIIDAFSPRQREILLCLALHPDGARRAWLTATLWPDAPGDRPYNSFRATLSQLRRALRAATGDTLTNVTLAGDGHYRLDPAVVDVDLWQLNDALTRSRRTPNAAARIAALRAAIDLYPADLADGLTAAWIDPPREELRRAILDAYSEIIHATTRDDPADALDLLERARGIDPCNEAIYRDLMRIQARLGRHDNIPRTLALLTSTLAGIGERPNPSTIALANNLQQQHGNHRQQVPRAS